MSDEANLTETYRQARRDFVAAVTAAGADPIARVHPERGPDGKPLFCDSAALGARGGSRALLLLGGPLSEILQKKPAIPEGAKLVMVHAPDPCRAAFGQPGTPRDWPLRNLAAIAGEDLVRVKTLIVLDMAEIASEAALTAALAAALPGATLRCRSMRPDLGIQAARVAIAAL